MSVMSVLEAREILGEDAAAMTDGEVEYLVDTLDVLAAEMIQAVLRVEFRAQPESACER